MNEYMNGIRYDKFDGFRSAMSCVSYLINLSDCGKLMGLMISIDLEVCARIAEVINRGILEDEDEV